MAVKVPPPPGPGTRLRHTTWGWGTVMEQRTYHHNTVSLVVQFDLHGERECVWKFVHERCTIDDGTITKEKIVADLKRAANRFQDEHPVPQEQENFLHATPPTETLRTRRALLEAVQRAVAFLEKS